MATFQDFIMRFKTQGVGDVNKASAAVKALSDDMAAFGQQSGIFSNSLSGILTKLGPLGLAAGAAGGAFVALGLRAVSMADELQDLSDATGISAGALKNFQNSVIDAGGKSEDFQKIAAKLNQSVQEAAGGNEKLQKAFQTLGVYVTDAGGKIRPTEQILGDLTRKFQNGEVTGAQYAAAIDLLGKTINRLDLTKLNAVSDPGFDQSVKKLAEFQSSIDKFVQRLNEADIRFFGNITKGLNDIFEQNQRLEEQANRMGRTAPTTPFGTPGGNLWRRFTERPMTQEEQGAYNMRNYRPRSDSNYEEPTGGWGATPASVLKATEELEKRNAAMAANIRRDNALRSANQLQAIEVNAAADIAKARSEIFARENLTKAQKEQEFALKTQEIQAKAALDTANLRRQMAAKAYADEEAQREEAARAIAAYEDAQSKAAVTAQERAAAYQESVDALQDQYLLEDSIRGLTEQQAGVERQVAEEIKRRGEALKELAKIENLTYEERLKREGEINAQSKRAIELIRERGAEEYHRSRNFTEAWDEAFKKYMDNAYNAAEASRTYFERFSKGFEDAFVAFLTRSKFSFKDFTNSLIADFARIEARKMFSALFGGPAAGGTEGSVLMKAFTWGKSLFGLANGGAVMGGTPYVVGERGPELFIPRGAGNVVANNALGRQQPTVVNNAVTYQIQAVDAASFRTLVAKDPSFIYAVTEAGRRSQPTRRSA